jgi:hypothetical protein
VSKRRRSISPKILESRRRHLGVAHRVLDVLVPEIGLATSVSPNRGQLRLTSPYVWRSDEGGHAGGQESIRSPPNTLALHYRDTNRDRVLKIRLKCNGNNTAEPTFIVFEVGPCDHREPNNFTQTQTSANSKRDVPMTLNLRRNSGTRPATGGTWLSRSRALPTIGN